MKNISKFQLIVLAIFVICIIAGVASFAFFKGGSSSSSLPSIAVWGTFPKDTFDKYVSEVSNSSAQSITINYTQKSQTAFSKDFVAALARGTGPDAILIPAELLLPHEDKLALIPYAALSARDFTDTYIQEANIYLNQNGILAIPFMIDPLVMYWNRDMFDAAGVATYPRFWDEFTDLTKTLTVKDQNGNIRKSAIAMGQFGNVTNAREIFGTLLMQSGNPVTTQATDGSVVSSIKTGSGVSPEAAIRFFVQFVNPANASYSWNRSQPASKTAFLSGNLATYFGFASELSELREKNPNINFDVALLPKPRTSAPANTNPAASGVTYGRIYGFSLVKSSVNLDGAFQIISMLTASAPLATLSESLYLPNVRRDVIASGSTDAYISLFNRAALVSNTWLDSDPTASSQIFGDMIEYFTSGQKTINQAIQDAGDQYNASLKQAVSQ